MAETINSRVDGERIATVSGQMDPSNGSVGLPTQELGSPTTVGSAAQATGGVAPGHLIEPDIDTQLYEFQSDDTPLMQLMLKAKKVKVNSPEVEHFMIDEPKSYVTTTEDVAASRNNQAVLPLDAGESKIPCE